MLLTYQRHNQQYSADYRQQAIESSLQTSSP